jgi:disulfide bond formation protein DsbB
MIIDAPQAMRRPGTASLALIVAAVATGAIGGAWFIQLALGVLPCKLCLDQRIPYYIGVPLAALTAWQAARQPAGLITTGLFVALGCVFAAAAGMGLYHAGIEWGLWRGPTDCTGSFLPAPRIGDFLKQLETVKVIRCDEVAMRIAGLSLAAWNMIVAAALSLLAFAGAWRSSPRAED